MTDSSVAWSDAPAEARASFAVPVTSRADGTSIDLPVLVARGATEGKTLVVTAGVHGDEFEGMRAIQQVFEQLQLEKLRGTFVAVPVANPPAFEAGLRVDPDDRQDMARIFPGDPAGTVTEQLAYALTHRFIRHADLFCDLHSAGQYYAMPPMSGYALHAEPLLTPQRQAAWAFGLPLIWGTPPLPGRSLSAAAEHNVPAIYAEITGEGRCRPGDVAMYARGIRGLLGFLGMTPPPPATTEPVVIEDPSENAGFLQRQLQTPVGGLFEATVAPGSRVKEGEEIGWVRDPFGQVRFFAKAPIGGMVVFLRTFSRVLAGDPLCCVLKER